MTFLKSKIVLIAIIMVSAASSFATDLKCGEVPRAQEVACWRQEMLIDIHRFYFLAKKHNFPLPADNEAEVTAIIFENPNFLLPRQLFPREEWSVSGLESKLKLDRTPSDRREIKEIRELSELIIFQHVKIRAEITWQKHIKGKF